jgi:hypothetical protein
MTVKDISASSEEMTIRGEREAVGRLCLDGDSTEIGPRVTSLSSEAAGYFFLSARISGCHVPILRLGAAAITFGFSFFGFLASRLPLCWPLAMTSSLICASSQFSSARDDHLRQLRSKAPLR